MASLCVLTVAVGEVQVPLSAGIAVLPSVIGFAVTAASEVLTSAISEVRFAVAAYRGDSSVITSTKGALLRRSFQKRLHKFCKFSPKIRSVILPLQNESDLEELLPLSLSHCAVPRKAAQPDLLLQESPRSLERQWWQWKAQGKDVTPVTATRPSWAPHRDRHNPLLPGDHRHPSQGHQAQEGVYKMQRKSHSR